MDDPNLEHSRRLLDDGKVEEALELLTNKLDDLAQTGNKRLLGFYHWQIASCHYSRQDTQSIIMHYETALGIFRTLDNSEQQIISLLTNLATIYKRIWEYESAIAYAQEAKVLAEKEDASTPALMWIIESILTSSQAAAERKAESLEQTLLTIEHHLASGNSLALEEEKNRLLQMVYQSRGIMQSVAYFNLMTLAEQTNNESMREEHRQLHSVLRCFADETKFRQHVESDLGDKNFRLFAAIWRVSRMAEQYQDIFTQEFLESIAGIWLFSNTIFINSFNLELESDFAQLSTQPGAQTEAVEEFEAQHRDMLTYWRIRYYAERSLRLSENEAGQAIHNLIVLCRLMIKEQDNLQSFIDLTEARFDAKIGEHRAAEQRLKRILDTLPLWDKCTALFELSQVSLALGEIAQALQYATQYLSMTNNLPWPNHHRLAKLGMIFAQAKKPQKVIECIEEWLLHSGDAATNDRSTITNLIILAQAYQQTARDLELQVTIDRLLEYTPETPEDYFLHAIIDLLGEMGWRFAVTHREQLAIKYMSICLELSRQYHLRDFELSALDIIGLSHSSLGQHIDAVPFYQQAVRLAHQMGEKEKAIDYMMNLTLSYQKILSVRTSYEDKVELEESIKCFEIVSPLMDELQEIEKKQQIQLNLSMMAVIANAPELERRYAFLLTNEQMITLQFLDAEFMTLRKTHGGMSTIYFALDKHPPFSAVVIKALKPELTHDWRFKEQFKREAEVWLELSDHPNIVSLRAIRELNNQIYLFFEIVFGQEIGKADLRHWIGTPMLTLENSLKFGCHICDAFDYAYTEFKERQVDFAHLDLKPENVLITKDGIAKVADFGISQLTYMLLNQPRTGENDKALETFTLSSLAVAAGTGPYMSPEQCRNERSLDIRSDIYSFGCLLFEMLTGEVLFKADRQDYARIHTSIAPNLSKLSQLPFGEELRKIIKRCCEKDKANRYQSFAELGDAIRLLYAKLTHKTLVKEKSMEQNAEQLVNAGIMRIQLDQIQDAIALFDQALQQDPNCVRAFVHKAVALKRLQRLTESLECCDQALEIDANQFRALAIKGDIFREKGDFQSAIDYYNRALLIEEDSTICWNKLGIALAHSGNFEEALKSHERALAINPEYLEARLNMCIDLFNLGKPLRFRDEFEQLKQLAPDHPGLRKLAELRALFPDTE